MPSLSGPRIQTALPGPAAQRLVERDRALISGSYTRGYPLVARRGEGMYVEDVDGNVFLDFTAGIAVCATGHCHPAVVEALQRQAAELVHMSGTDFYYELMITVAEQLSRTAPMPGPHRVYFGNSGTEAIETALKLARWHSRRQAIIGFYGGFHGRTYGALSLTSSKVAQRARFAPLLPGFYHIGYPNPYRLPPGADASGAIDTAPTLAALEELDRLFHTVVPPQEVAAIVFEPVQGEGGYVVPPLDFVRELRRRCDEHGILLIADEVQSGCGRTGKMWAIEHFGVAPDILCCAKGIASGMPLGAVLAPAAVMDWTPGAHASTFGGNPLSLAAATVTLDLLQRELIANAAAVGQFLLGRLRPWLNRFPTVGDVRGLGLMIGIEIVHDQASKRPDPETRDRIVQAAFQKGLLLLGCGASSIRLMPPLICTEAEAGRAVEILQACVAESAA